MLYLKSASLTNKMCFCSCLLLFHVSYSVSTFSTFLNSAWCDIWTTDMPNTHSQFLLLWKVIWFIFSFIFFPQPTLHLSSHSLSETAQHLCIDSRYIYALQLNRANVSWNNQKSIMVYIQWSELSLALHVHYANPHVSRISWILISSLPPIHPTTPLFQLLPSLAPSSSISVFLPASSLPLSGSNGDWRGTFFPV